MTTASQILDIARSQIGYVEGAGNHTKYGAAYGMDGVSWCAEFQWWVFHQAGADVLIPKTAYTPTFYSWFQARGQASHSPRVGDLVFYNWPGDGVDRIQHVGIVEAVNGDGTITTIEGNTSSGTSGSQSNGGGVYRRRRSTSAVVGYGRPAYAAAPAPTPEPAPAPAGPRQISVDGGLGPETIKRWQEIMGTGADGVISNPSDLVKAVQRTLNARIGAGLLVDGRGIAQDGHRYNTVAALQRYLGTPADGVLSKPKSQAVEALQRRLNTGGF